MKERKLYITLRIICTGSRFSRLCNELPFPFFLSWLIPNLNNGPKPKLNDAPDRKNGIIIITKPIHMYSMHFIIHPYVQGRLSKRLNKIIKSTELLGRNYE